MEPLHLINSTRASKILGVSRQRVEQLVKAGKLEPAAIIWGAENYSYPVFFQELIILDKENLVKPKEKGPAVREKQYDYSQLWERILKLQTGLGIKPYRLAILAKVPGNTTSLIKHNKYVSPGTLKKLKNALEIFGY